MYIAKIKDVSRDCKYLTWYVSLIRRATERGESPERFEVHHIVPRSFGMGGYSTKSNLVKLSCREHYIAHKLLSKMVVDKKLKQKCVFALFQLSCRYSFLSSREYAKAKEDVSSAMKLLWKDPAYLRKQAEATKIKYNSTEYKAFRSESATRQMADPEQKAHAIKTLAAAHKTIDHSSDIWLSRSMHSKAAKEKAKEANKTKEHRDRCRARELSKSPEEREALAKIGAAALMGKFKSKAEFSAHLSNRILGRRKVVKMSTLEVKVVHVETAPEGFVFFKELSKADRAILKSRSL